MDRISRALAALLLSTAGAYAQNAILEGGPWTAGHLPMYAVSGGSQPVIQDAGGAAGGAAGTGLAEFLQINRPGNGVNSAPFASNGNGPASTHNCMYDGPTTGQYHYLCFDANAQGGALIDYGAGGGAPALPLHMTVNGVTATFPFGTAFTGPANTMAIFGSTGTLGGSTTLPTGFQIPTSSLSGSIPISEITGLNYLRVQAYGAVLDGVTDDSTAINSAITAANAGNVGPVVLCGGTSAIANTITLQQNAPLFICDGSGVKWTGSSGGMMFTTPAGSLTYRTGLIGSPRATIDPNSLAGTIIKVNSVVHSEFGGFGVLTGTTSTFGLDLASSGANLAGNWFHDWYFQGTIGTPIRFTGASSSYVITLNTFDRIYADDVNVYGINFAQWADTNWFGDLHFTLVGSGSAGVIFNSAGTCTSDLGIYSESFRSLAVDTFGSSLNRSGVILNDAKDIVIDNYSQQPEAENGPIVNNCGNSFRINRITKSSSYYMDQWNYNVAYQNGAPILANGIGFGGLLASGTQFNLLGITSGNAVRIGDSNLPLQAPSGSGTALGAFTLQMQTALMSFGVDSNSPYEGWIGAHTTSGAYLPFSINPWGGNVGINTTNPAYPFDVAGAVRTSADLISGGSAPALSGTCSMGTQTGGAKAGTFKASSSCASGGTVILTFGTSAPTGRSCSAHDQTTPGALLNQTAGGASATTATLTVSGSSVANSDIIAFDCEAF